MKRALTILKHEMYRNIIESYRAAFRSATTKNCPLEDYLGDVERLVTVSDFTIDQMHPEIIFKSNLHCSANTLEEHGAMCKIAEQMYVKLYEIEKIFERLQEITVASELNAGR